MHVGESSKGVQCLCSDLNRCGLTPGCGNPSGHLSLALRHLGILLC